MDKSCFDATGVGGCQTPVERKCLSQTCSSITGLSMLEAALPNTFERAHFFKWRTNGSGNPEGLDIVDEGIVKATTCKERLTQIVERFCFAKSVTEVAV